MMENIEKPKLNIDAAAMQVGGVTKVVLERLRRNEITVDDAKRIVLDHLDGAMNAIQAEKE